MDVESIFPIGTTCFLFGSAASLLLLSKLRHFNYLFLLTREFLSEGIIREERT